MRFNLEMVATETRKKTAARKSRDGPSGENYAAAGSDKDDSFQRTNSCRWGHEISSQLTDRDRLLDALRAIKVL